MVKICIVFIQLKNSNSRKTWKKDFHIGWFPSSINPNGDSSESLSIQFSWKYRRCRWSADSAVCLFWDDYSNWLCYTLTFTGSYFYNCYKAFSLVVVDIRIKASSSADQVLAMLKGSLDFSKKIIILSDKTHFPLAVAQNRERNNWTTPKLQWTTVWCDFWASKIIYTFLNIF